MAFDQFDIVVVGLFAVGEVLHVASRPDLRTVDDAPEMAAPLLSGGILVFSSLGVHSLILGPLAEEQFRRALFWCGDRRRLD